MRRTVFWFQISILQVAFGALLRQEGKDGDTGRSDTQREAPSLIEDKRADGECAILAQQAHCFISAPCRKEGALSGCFGERGNVLAGKLADVVAFSGHCA